MKVVDEDAAQKFMNKFKSLLGRAHRSLQPVLSRADNGGIRNSGLFESRENEGIHELSLLHNSGIAGFSGHLVKGAC